MEAEFSIGRVVLHNWRVFSFYCMNGGPAEMTKGRGRVIKGGFGERFWVFSVETVYLHFCFVFKFLCNTFIPNILSMNICATVWMEFPSLDDAYLVNALVQMGL